MDENERRQHPKGGNRPEPLDMESTAYLLAEVRAGRTAAREVLYERYLGRLKRWARGRLPPSARDLMNTDDLVQQTLTNVLVRIDEFEPNHAGSFQAYLRRTLLNQIRDQIRRAARRPMVGEPSMESFQANGPSPLELAVGTETAERYERALEKLKPRDREVVIAHVEFCFDYSEIAREFGKSSSNAARMAVSRALRRLASEMSSS